MVETTEVVVSDDKTLGKRKKGTKNAPTLEEPAGKKLSTFEMVAKQRAEKAAEKQQQQAVKKEEIKQYDQLSAFQAQLWADVFTNTSAVSNVKKEASGSGSGDNAKADDDEVKAIEVINVDPFAYTDTSNCEHANPVSKGGMQNLKVPLIVTGEIKKSKNDSLDYYCFLCSVPVLNRDAVPDLDGVGGLVDVEGMKYPVLQINQHSKVPLKNGQSKWVPNPLLDPQQFYPGQQFMIAVDCKDGTCYSNLDTIAGSIFEAEGLKPCDNGRINASNFTLVSSVQDNYPLTHYELLQHYLPRDYVWFNNLNVPPPKKETNAPIIVVAPPAAAAASDPQANPAAGANGAEAKKEQSGQDAGAVAAAQKAEEDKIKAIQEMANKAKKERYKNSLKSYKDSLPHDLQLVHSYPVFLLFGVSSPLEPVDPGRGFLQQYMDFENTNWTWKKTINEVEVEFPALEFDIVGKQWNEELLVPFDKPEKVFIKTKIWNPENVLGISLPDCWKAIAPVALKAPMPPGMMFAKSKVDDSYFLQTPAAYANRLRAEVGLSMEVNDASYPIEGLLSYYGWPLTNDAAVSFIERLMKKRGVKQELDFSFNGGDFIPDTHKKLSRDCQKLFNEHHPSVDNLLETSRSRFMLMTTAMLGKKSNPQVCVLAPHLFNYQLHQKLQEKYDISAFDTNNLKEMKEFVSAAFEDPQSEQGKFLGMDQWTEEDWRCCVPFTIKNEIFEHSFYKVGSWVRRVKEKLTEYMAIAGDIKKERAEKEKEEQMREEMEKELQETREAVAAAVVANTPPKHSNGETVEVTNGYSTQDPGDNDEQEESSEEECEGEEEEEEGEEDEEA